MNKIETIILKPELHNAIETAKKECNNQYALTYLHAIPQAINESGMLGSSPENGLKVQLLYVLSNMSHWRGELAKNCKAIIKKYSKGEYPFIKGINPANN